MNDLRRRLLPPVGVLQSFVIAARHESVSLAARETGLTQSAVSRQIAQLEEIIGQALFHRAGRRIALTEAGAAYAEAIGPAIDAIRRATGEAMAKRRDGEFTIATLPSFGMRWLAPRLPQLTSAHPEMVVNMAARSEPFELAASGFDAAIHYGRPDWENAAHDLLFPEESVPVCAPAFLADHDITGAADLIGCPLLGQSLRQSAWEDWFALNGVTGTVKLSGRFDHFMMLAQAAVSGGGVAMMPRFLVAQELASGALVIPVDRPLQSRLAYYLVYPHDRLGYPRFRLLRDWIVAEAARTRSESTRTRSESA